MYYRMIFSSKEKFDFVLVAVIILKLNTSSLIPSLFEIQRKIVFLHFLFPINSCQIQHVPNWELFDGIFSLSFAFNDINFLVSSEWIFPLKLIHPSKCPRFAVLLAKPGFASWVATSPSLPTILDQFSPYRSNNFWLVFFDFVYFSTLMIQCQNLYNPTLTTSSEVINIFSQKKFISYNLFSLAYIASEVSKVSSMTFSKFSKPYFLIARWIIAPEPVYPII